MNEKCQLLLQIEMKMMLLMEIDTKKLRLQTRDDKLWRLHCQVLTELMELWEELKQRMNSVIMEMNEARLRTAQQLQEAEVDQMKTREQLIAAVRKLRQEMVKTDEGKAAAGQTGKISRAILEGLEGHIAREIERLIKEDEAQQSQMQKLVSKMTPPATPIENGKGDGVQASATETGKAESQEAETQPDSGQGEPRRRGPGRERLLKLIASFYIGPPPEVCKFSKELIEMAKAVKTPGGGSIMDCLDPSKPSSSKESLGGQWAKAYQKWAKTTKVRLAQDIRYPDSKPSLVIVERLTEEAASAKEAMQEQRQKKRDEARDKFRFGGK